MYIFQVHMSFVNTSALQGTACQLPTLLHLTGTENPSATVLWSLFDGQGFLTTPASPDSYLFVFVVDFLEFVV